MNLTSTIERLLTGLFPNYRKLFIAIAIISLGISIFSYFSISLTEYIGNSGLFDKPERDVPITFLGIFIFSIAMVYLQSGEKEKNVVHDIYEFKKLEKKIDETNKKIQSFESKNSFTPEEKNTLKSTIIKNTSEETIKTIFDDKAHKLTGELLETLGLETFKESFYHSIERINEEIRKLNLRANVSLAIGMIISFGGIYMLFISIDMFNSSDFLRYVNNQNEMVNKTSTEILIQMLPRLSFVFIIELFAFFFLRLYKAGLDEIKYFQNELTNIESKLISVEVAYITKDEKSMKEALKVLVQTERNFILKKGETTVELERAKSESENMQNIIKAVPNLFKSKGK